MPPSSVTATAAVARQQRLPPDDTDRPAILLLDDRVQEPFWCREQEAMMVVGYGSVT